MQNEDNSDNVIIRNGYVGINVLIPRAEEIQRRMIGTSSSSSSSSSSSVAPAWSVVHP
jgi:hypothetical protein